jgi:hypothetical protein
MPNEPVLLAALIAPGSIESEVGKVQAGLFSDHGLASAEVLPPLVPIAFLDAARIGPGFLLEMNRAVRPGWRISMTGPRWVEGHLYAGVDSGGAWSLLRECALGRSSAETSCLFPVAEGFYLGCSEAAAEVKSLIQPLLPPVSFTSCLLALVRISASLAGLDWWQSVSWELAEERSLRGRKDP